MDRVYVIIVPEIFVLAEVMVFGLLRFFMHNKGTPSLSLH
jgi:hypothetical protein